MPLCTARRSCRIALLIGALTIPACGKSRDSGQQTAQTARTISAPQSCADKSAALAAWIEAFRHDGVAPPHYARYRGYWAGESLVVATDAPSMPIDRTRVMTIKRMLDTVGTSDVKQQVLAIVFMQEYMGALDVQYDWTMELLYDRLTFEEEMFQNAVAHAKDQGLTRMSNTLAFGPKTPWWSVVALTEMFQHFGYRKLHFLFRAPPTAEVPAPGPRFQERQGWQHEYGAPAWLDGLPDLITNECAPARELLATMKPLINEIDGFKEPPLLRKPEVLSGMVEAVRSCDCQVDINELKLLLASLAARGEGLLLRTAVLTLADNADDDKQTGAADTATPLVADRDAPWQDTHRLIIEHARAHPDQPVSLRLNEGPSRTRDFLARQPARIAAQKKAFEEDMQRDSPRIVD